MAEKTHFNSRTKKNEPCHATKRKCRYKDSIMGTPIATKSGAVKKTIKPFIPTKSLLPDNVINPTKNFSSSSYLIDADYGYDSYQAPFNEEPQDYGRNNVYEGLRLISVNPKGSAAALLNLQEKDLPSSLEEIINQNPDWGNVDEWEITAEKDWYGETVYIEAPTDFKYAILDWYYGHSNAEDTGGVLEYVRGRGMDTSGLSPSEALKKNLMRENNNIRIPEIDKAEYLLAGNIKLEDIQIPQPHHFGRVEARPLISPKGVKKQEKLAGVLWSDGRGHYKLLDGYHRTKWLTENNKKYAKYFILRPSNPYLSINEVEQVIEAPRPFLK